MKDERKVETVEDFKLRSYVATPSKSPHVERTRCWSVPKSGPMHVYKVRPRKDHRGVV